MKSLLRWGTGSSSDGAWAATVLIRIVVGLIFILAGYRKFTEPQEMGPGRFEELGFANPGFWSAFVGVFELLGGALVLIGLLTRLGAIPLVVTMIMAIWITKVPRLGNEELVAVLHASRLDFAMLLSSIYLVIAGGGRLAVDRAFDQR